MILKIIVLNLVKTQNGLNPKKKDIGTSIIDWDIKKNTSAQKSKKKLATYRHKEKYPEKFKARILCQKMNPVTEGNHLHHWSYREEYAKDVIELDPKTHAFLHRYINYDQEKMMYRVSSNLNGWYFGELLDTKEKHKRFLGSCIRQNEM